MARFAKKAAAAVNPTDLLERFKDFPAIDVIERRFNDPNDPGSLPIFLKDEANGCCVNSDHQNKLKAGATTCHLCKQPARKWYVRFTNTQQEGRWAQIRAKGYVPVELDELKDEQDVADLVKNKESSGKVFVRRGDRGQEVLVKMPLELYNEIKRRQRAQREQAFSSRSKMQADLAESAGREIGDEAGQLIHDGEIRVESMKRTHTTLAEEAGGDD
jgi:hypothetical protein